MVSTKCFTFNHALYIEDALRGFAIQQTSFPINTVVVDDASTDGEPDILCHWAAENLELTVDGTAERETDDARIIEAKLKGNQNHTFVIILLRENHHSRKRPKQRYMAEWVNAAKYHALCEGDDYWIDPQKLQKQVEFMEKHPGHSLCFCSFKKLFPTGETRIIKRYGDNLEECPMEDIILGGGGYMATNSMMYRRNMYVSYTSWAIGCPISDGPITLTLASVGLVGYLTDVMCVYRVSAVGSWSSSMSSNAESRRIHHLAMVKMWHQFDEFSKGKYHKTIRKKLVRNQIGYIHYELLLFWNRIRKKYTPVQSHS